MDKVAVGLALQELAATLATRNPTEDDLEKGFVHVYRALGYATAGRDYRNKSRDVSGIPDVMLHNSDRSIQVIVELKKPSESLKQHTNQLAGYLRSLREARWGLLSNGKVWRAYQRDGQNVDLVWELTLEDLQSDSSALEIFKRQLIEVTNYKQVAEREKDQRQYLEMLKISKTELEKTRQEIQKLEGQLNDIVYSVFILTAQDRKVIESFLERF